MHFDNLFQKIRLIDQDLADSMQRVETGWKTPDPEDAELTELIAAVLLGCIRDDMFSIETMVTGFKAFAHDFFERQMDCIRSGAYLAKDYEVIRKEVYTNDAYMATTYYPALLLSYLASPNYRHILRSLRSVLLQWQNTSVGRIIDIASGHGLLLLYALNVLQTARGVSVDLSPVAAKFAAQLQVSTGWADSRFECATRDLLVAESAEFEGEFDAAICCELLEHIPNPAEFLQRIRKFLRPGGRLFISAAVRMESVDHLTFFAKISDVAELIQLHGFAITREMSVPFVTKRPSNEARWNRLLEDPAMAVTYIAECTAL